MTAPTPRAGAAGVGCLVLFLLPFAATGLFTAFGALRHAAAGEWGPAAFMGLFGLTFGFVGFGGMFAALGSRRSAAEVDAARVRHPDEPWLWRADWAAGRIEDGNRSTMIAAWVLAGFWNLISLPGAYFAVREAMREGNRAALIALLFPLVGFGLLVWAVRASLRYRRYGVSRLDLATVPVAIGRELRGTVVARGLLPAPGGFGVTLTCVRRVTRGSGKNRSTTETVLWQEEQRSSGTQSRTADGMMTSVPVAFRIPADVEPADDTDRRNTVIWRLAVSADVPGVDYHSSFEVPVFRAAAAAAAEDPDVVPVPVTREPYLQPATSRIKVTRNRRGTEIVFPAGRNPGASAGLTAFVAVWLAAVWATVYLDAPIFFQAVFGVIGLLLAWAALASWFGVSRVTIGDGTVTVARGLFAPLRERRMGTEEIEQVDTRIGMQAGGTPYYDLILVRKDGKKVPAGRTIREKREAEWLADTVRAALRD